MGTITSGIGLVSGINTTEIINQLMRLEERPKTTLQTRIDNTNKQKLALVDLSTQFASLKLYMTSMKKPSAFTSAVATSSNEAVMTASTTGSPTPGSYQFQVARLVTTQQAISNGFSNFNTTPVGAGKITIEQGGGDLTQPSALSELRGATGEGVRRGQFRLTDRSGRSSVVDISAAVSLEDVVKKINTNVDVSVRASIDGDGLKLTDLSGGTGNLTVLDVGTGTSAADLGIAKSVNAATLSGDAINGISRSMQLSQLNDGRGVRTAPSAASDFRVTFADNSSLDINLSAAKSVGEMIDTINKADPAKLRASIAADGHGFKLEDLTVSGGDFTVTALNGSKAAADLGIDGAVGNTEINGGWVLSKLNTVLLSSLKGGQGVTTGSITITNRRGDPDVTVDLTSAKTVQDVLDTINNAGAGVTASLKSSGNGIQITDTTGGSGPLTIADFGTDTFAQALGIAGTFEASNVQGENLQRQWVTENSLLSTYNGGKGVGQGVIKITNSAGKTFSVDLTGLSIQRLGDVIKAINAKNGGVTASINENGDGLLLTDTAGGGGKLLVEDTAGTVAADLNIKGKSESGTRIDGSFERTIDVTATDTLATLQTKIQTLNFGIGAQIINDGSASSPYRLSMTAKNTGVAGRVVLDMGSTSVQAQNLVDAQDAAVFVGGASGVGQPLLITASRNQISGVIAGVSIDLHAVSASPVSLDVSRNIDTSVEQMTKFAEGFNAVLDKIAELTKFDAATGTKGILLGDATVRGIADQMFQALNSTLKEGGRFKVLSDVGLKIVSGGRVEFDEDKFRSAYGTDPDAVQRLFTHMETKTDEKGKEVTVGKGLGYVLENAITKLIDPVNGLITQENKTLDGRTTQFQSKINTLDKMLTAKRLRLERQFAQMESVLAKLQTQQSSLGSIQMINYSNNSGS
jgi:flagellar hook-associated protein 2